MRIYVRNNYQFILLMTAQFCAGLFVIFAIWDARGLDADEPVPFEKASFIIGGMIFTMAVQLASLAWFMAKHIKRLHGTQNWLIDSVNWNFEKLKQIELGLPIKQSGLGEATQSHKHWPWGEHHTEYLGHLEAAARKWWTLYDPSDITTAPTNEIVSDWLQEERNLSREKARAIASMLRPDGLPTGPRK